MREPQGAVAGARERRVPRAVALEGSARAVEAPAVGLDDEPGAGEEEVNPKAGDGAVHGGRRQAPGGAEREEALLELAAGQRGARAVGVEGGSELRRSVMAGVPRDEGIEDGQVEASGDRGFLDRAVK